MLEQAIDLRFDLRASFLPIGEFGYLLDNLREAETLTKALDDRGRLGRVSAYLMNYCLAMGHAEAVDQPYSLIHIVSEGLSAERGHVR